MTSFKMFDFGNFSNTKGIKVGYHVRTKFIPHIMNILSYNSIYLRGFRIDYFLVFINS
jgi:hypothetical protein